MKDVKGAAFSLTSAALTSEGAHTDLKRGMESLSESARQLKAFGVNMRGSQSSSSSSSSSLAVKV